MPKVVVDWKTLYSFVEDSFVGVGVPREDAKICADVLLESDKEALSLTELTALSPFISTE